MKEVDTYKNLNWFDRNSKTTRLFGRNFVLRCGRLCRARESVARDAWRNYGLSHYGASCNLIAGNNSNFACITSRTARTADRNAQIWEHHERATGILRYPCGPYIKCPFVYRRSTFISITNYKCISIIVVSLFVISELSQMAKIVNYLYEYNYFYTVVCIALYKGKCRKLITTKK